MIRFIDSFDHYATAEITQKWTSTSGGSVTIGSGGRNSTNALICTGNDAPVTVSVAASGATAIVGFAFKPADVGNGSTTRLMCSIMRSGTVHISLGYTSSGAIRVQGPAGTTLATSPAGLLTTGVYSYIEFKTVLDDSAGTIEVRVNGTPVVGPTGSLDTANGTATWDTFRIGQMGGGGSGAFGSFDDIYLADGSGSTGNDFLGPVRAKVILPDGAGASTDFTPSAGSNYQNVDETLTDGDTTYNAEATAGDHDTYTFAALGITGTVKAVQVNMMVRSDGAGSETIAPMIRIGGTDYQGTTQGLSTSYSDRREIFEVSPATAVAFTVSEIDGAEFGIKLVS